MSQQAVMTCKQAIDMIIALGKLLWEKTEKSSDFEAQGTARQLSRYSWDNSTIYTCIVVSKPGFPFVKFVSQLSKAQNQTHGFKPTPWDIFSTA